MSSEYPEDNISGAGLASFQRHIAECTNGVVTTENYFGNRLNIPSDSAIDAARQGVITGADAFAGAMTAAHGIFGLSSLPFAFRSIQHASVACQSARHLYDAALKSLNLRLLYITIWPATGLWSNRPIESLRDLRSLTIRTYDDRSANFLLNIGARAEHLPFNHAVQMINDGKINAMLSSGDGGAGPQFWQRLKHFYAIDFAVPASIAFVRADALDGMPKTVIAGIESAARMTERHQFDSLSGRISSNAARMTAGGVTIHATIAEDVIGAMQQAASRSIKGWAREVGGDASSILQAAAIQSH